MRRLSRRNKQIAKTSSFVQTDHGLVSFQLVRSSARRSLTLSIDDNAQIQLAVPFHCAQEQIFGFIKQKSSWISRKLAQARRYRDTVRAKRFDDGHEFFFLGKPARLAFSYENIKQARIDFDGSRWMIALPQGIDENRRERAVRARLMQWYRQQAQEILGERTRHYAAKIDVNPARIAVKSFKRLWGNCDFRKRLVQFNWQIILSPLEVIDYVIVHELCHLLHPNHSRRFWDKVEEHMPDYRQHQHWLKENCAHMVLP